MIASKVDERWLISMTDMPTPGSATRSRWTCSRTGSGSTAGPEEKLKIRSVMGAPSERDELEAEDVLVAAGDGGERRSGGAPSMLIRATAASASSKMMFSVSRTLIPSAAKVLEDVGQDARPVLVADDEQVGRRRPAGEVDDVRDAPGLLERADDPDGLGGDRLLRLLGRGADVVGPVDAGQGEQRQAVLGGAGRRARRDRRRARPGSRARGRRRPGRRGRRPRRATC